MSRKIILPVLFIVLVVVALYFWRPWEEVYAPDIDPGDFVSGVDNPYFTLEPGRTLVYEGKTEEGVERVEVMVTDEQKTVMGIEATVVWDRVYLDEELIEDTRDWYAQDKEGNVWYLGEDSKEIEDGEVVSTEGSWEAGVDGAEPGIVMMADPEVGEIYRQEFYVGVAEDMAEVVALDESAEVPYGSFEGCLQTRDWSPLEENSDEFKFYCPELGGLVLELGKYSGERVELVEVEEEMDETVEGTYAPADLSNAEFLDLESDSETKQTGFIENPTTGDRQSVRIYSPEARANSASPSRPLVVIVAGGAGEGSGFEQGPEGKPNQAELLSEEGFTVIVFDALGVGESEGKQNFQGYADQDGLAAIVAAGKELPQVDSTNVGLASFSYGITNASGVLARYPELEIKFLSDWEGPSSREFTTVGCGTEKRVQKESVSPASMPCDLEEHWVQREAVNFIKDANVDYYWRIQQEKDHVQDTYGHTVEMIDAAVGNIAWVKLNDGEPNDTYTEETVPTVSNGNFFALYAIPHIVTMAEF